MIIGVVVTIFCALGIYGYFGGIIFLTYIGAVLSIIEQFIEISTGRQIGCPTVWILILLALGITAAGNNFFESLAICLCFENVIFFVGGIILLGVMMVETSKEKNN